MRGSLKRVRKTMAVSALAAAAVLVVAAPASAHNYYISSTPGIDETLTTLPEEFIVTTNDNLLDLHGGGGFFMEIEGPEGLYYGDGCVTVSGPSVTTPAVLGPPGDYSLNWQVISADGHTVSGEVPFRWHPSEAAESPATGSETAPRCGAESGAPADDEDPQNGLNGQAAADDTTTDMLWIGGAIGAVAAAVIATLLLIRPRQKPDGEAPHEGSDAP